MALFEYTFWLCITASALTGFTNDPIKIIILIAAFSIGNVFGSVIEEKMALGYCSITGLFVDKNVALQAAALLREQGHALTIIPAEGIQGAERIAILTTAKRKNVAHIKETLFSVDPEVFLTVQATQQVKGATLAQNLK